MSELKTYETAGEIVDCLVDFHLRAARLAELAMDMEQEERVGLLFNFLFDHHLQMQEVLVTCEDDEESVMDVPTAVTLNADAAPEAFLDSLEYHPNMSLEAALQLARALADYTLDLLADVRGEVADTLVDQLLDDIEEQEQEALKLLMRGVGTLRDL